ncbi:MAG: ABC transporter permease [Candidatus Hydrogenedens sp.]|jgi:peptide/nickel transport system permease protein|nr:ABC transporter permease [Candidatus Hydrogenedens sp.]NLV69989.1 ABC transporter permease [Clostridiales bacterium]
MLTIIKRLLQGVLVIFLVLTVTFFLLRLIPGDPARLIAGNAEESVVQELREEMGLTKPVLVQYKDYMLSLFTGNMGFSYFAKNDVAYVIANSYKPTLVMISIALPSAIIVGLLIGLLCAVFRETPFDRILTSIAVLFQSMPNYWVAIMLIQIVGVKLGWFPASGYKDPSHAILPALVLGLPLTGVFARSIRTNLIGAMQQDFSKAAKARGVPYLNVLMGYSFRDTLVGFLTLVASQLGFMMGNCLLIENIFAYPGLGLQTLNAILRRDYFLVQGLVALLAAVFIAINTLVDISYMYLDPRIRKAQGGL